MKHFFLFFLFLIIIVGTLAEIQFVNSQELPNYNFGTMQADQQINIKPGDEVVVKLYFYNIYGNRPTHILLNITSRPDDLEINILPEPQNKDYDVSGEVRSVLENLVIYPSNASSSAGTNTETIEYINSKVGWIAANFVTINVKAPSDAKIGDTFNLKIVGNAFWLGQGGSVALQQQRDFEYNIKIVSSITDYYEKPLDETIETENRNATSINLGKLFGANMENPILLISIGTTLTLIIILIVLMILVFRKKKDKEIVWNIKDKNKHKRKK